MNIKKVIYDDIENLHANDLESTIHYIVDYENGNFEFFLDVDHEDYINSDDFDALVEVIENYFWNGFFIADPVYDNIEMFKNECYHLFEDDLINELYDAYDACKVIFEKN